MNGSTETDKAGGSPDTREPTSAPAGNEAGAGLMAGGSMSGATGASPRTGGQAVLAGSEAGLRQVRVQDSHVVRGGANGSAAEGRASTRAQGGGDGVGGTHALGSRSDPATATALRMILWIVNAGVLGALGLLLFPTFFGLRRLPAGTGRMDSFLAFIVLGGCATPPLLTWLCYALINKKSTSQHATLEVPDGLDLVTVTRVLASWNYEICRIRWHLARAECFSGLWGLMTTIILVGAAVFLSPPGFHTLGTPYLDRYNLVAFAVVGAASTRFLLDVTSVCVRIANDDVTKRMFAEALRSLVLSVIATLAVVLVPAVFGADGPFSATAGAAKAFPEVLKALGIGASIAVLGIPAFQLVVERLATALGMKKAEPPRGTPLGAIPGITDSEIARLGEEGIGSLEALVNTPLPRLFLGTRFSLQRLCDWVDKGILLCRLGTSATDDLRTRAGVDGALDIFRIARLDAAAMKPCLTTIKGALRFESEEQAECFIRSIARCDAVILADAFRQMVPVDVDPANTRDAVTEPMEDPSGSPLASHNGPGTASASHSGGAGAQAAPPSL